MGLTRTACMTAVLLALAAPANAEIVAVNYRAVMNLGGGLGFLQDVEVFGTIVYDTEAAPIVSHFPGTRTYPVISHDVELDGVPFSGTGAKLEVLDSVQIFLPGGATTVRDAVRFSADLNGTFDGISIIGVSVDLRDDEPSPGSDTLTDLLPPSTQQQFNGLSDYRVVGVTYPVSGGQSTDQGAIISFEISGEEEPVVAACEGFYSPFDVAIGLPRKANRVIPLTVSLWDGEVELMPDGITAPTVSVTRTSGIGGGELEELVESAGRATEGNSFVWDEVAGLWSFNLATKSYNSVGTYRVHVVAGDGSYAIDPTCTGIFVRQ